MKDKDCPVFILHSGFIVLHLKWWEVLVTLQFVASDNILKTPDLQSGSRITSLKNSKSEVQNSKQIRNRNSE